MATGRCGPAETLAPADRLDRDRDRLAPAAAAGRSERYGMDKRHGQCGMVQAVATAASALPADATLADLPGVRH